MLIRRRIMELGRRKPADGQELDLIQRELIAIFQSLPAPDNDGESRDVATRLRDTCYAALSEHCSKITSKYIRRYSNNPGVESTVHEALFGAVNRFDPSFENPFTAFADRTIRGNVARYFRDELSKNTKVLRPIHDQAMDIRKLQKEFSDEEVCRLLDISPERMTEVLSIAKQPKGLVSHTDMNTAERILGERSATPEARSDRVLNAVYQELLRVFEPLTERHRLTLKHRFGIVRGEDGMYYHDQWFDKRLQSEIADMVGQSQVHVSRTMRAIQDRLRQAASE